MIDLADEKLHTNAHNSNIDQSPYLLLLFNKKSTKIDKIDKNQQESIRINKNQQGSTFDRFTRIDDYTFG